MGVQDAYVPAYLAEFEVARLLGIPAAELPNQPSGLVRAAWVKLEADAARAEMEREAKGQ